MKIEIETNSDTWECETCGSDWADGGRDYGRILGDSLGLPKSCYMRVKNGEFQIEGYNSTGG